MRVRGNVCFSPVKLIYSTMRRHLLYNHVLNHWTIQGWLVLFYAATGIVWFWLVTLSKPSKCE